MTQKRNICEVVANGLCVGCGTCVAICPHNAVTISETHSGLLVAAVDAEKCNLCGVCMKVCPGWHLEAGLLEKDIDPFKGRVVAAYCAQATKKDLLSGAQSGGVVTALLCHLIDSGQIDKAAVTQMPDDGSLRPQTVVTSDPNEIWKAHGSKYCPVAVNASLTSQAKAERLAVVGLGCHVHGLRNIQAQHFKNCPNILLTIGLICEHTLLYGAIDYLIDKANVSRKDVAYFRFKSKRYGGWPGDVYIRTHNKTEYRVSQNYRVLSKVAFTPARCRLCFDKLNVLSDLSCGDAWGVQEDKEGVSIILVRTQRGLYTVMSAEKAGLIRLDAIEPNSVFKGQAIEQRRRDWTAYTAAEKKARYPVPDFSIDTRWQPGISDLSLRPYRRQLKWARYLSCLDSPEQCLGAAKKHLFLLRLRNFLSPRFMVKRLFRLVRKLGLKSLLA